IMRPELLAGGVVLGLGWLPVQGVPLASGTHHGDTPVAMRDPVSHSVTATLLGGRGLTAHSPCVSLGVVPARPAQHTVLQAGHGWTRAPRLGGRMHMSAAIRQWSRLIPVMCLGVWLLGSLLMPPALVHGDDGGCDAGGDVGGFVIFPLFDVIGGNQTK